MKNLYKKGVYLVVYAICKQSALSTLQTLSTFALSLLLIASSTRASAQINPTIKSQLNGIVLDAGTSQPLPGAVVKIKGTTHSVSTDPDGKFSFVTGQAFPYTLQVSFIGYDQKELVVNGSPVTVRLQEVLNQLNDVVVTGYSTQERKYIAGAISSISGQ